MNSAVMRRAMEMELSHYWEHMPVNQGKDELYNLKYTEFASKQ
jgi:hypothetical protein